MIYNVYIGKPEFKLLEEGLRFHIHTHHSCHYAVGDYLSIIENGNPDSGEVPRETWLEEEIIPTGRFLFAQVLDVETFTSIHDNAVHIITIVPRSITSPACSDPKFTVYDSDVVREKGRL